MTDLAAILDELLTKPSVFVSYHHGNDQDWYNEFTRMMSSQYQLFSNRSLDEPIDSANPEYIERRIRERHITGTSCTVVLIGRDTWRRKYVDWEVSATLHKGHGLVGVFLPTFANYMPYRYWDNQMAGYAVGVDWTQGASGVQRAIALARSNAKGSLRLLMNNRRPKMSQNL